MAVDTDMLKELDSHWKEVMGLAERYGFIVQAYGGTATLATHKVQLEAAGEERYLDNQRVMFGNYLEKI